MIPKKIISAKGPFTDNICRYILCVPPKSNGGRVCFGIAVLIFSTKPSLPTPN